MRKVEVVPYNAGWVDEFSREAAQLQRVFAAELVAIHHIGSTSVPGLQAKPIIDIMPVVSHIDRVDALNPQMEALGYEPMGELGILGRRYFRKGGDDRTHHVHVFQAGSGEIDRHLAFRDYLRAHPDVARQYGELKAQLARRFSHDIQAYMDGKDAFIKETERRALDWRRR